MLMNLLSMYSYGLRGGALRFDWTYLLALAGLALTMAAQAKVQSTFSTYNKVRSSSGLTGAAAAQAVLHAFGIFDVAVEPIAGNLTDHYDPGSKTLRLSESTFGSGSVAAICVAAHECGHAKQDAEHYSPLVLRSSLVPAARIGSSLAWPVFIAGLMTG